MNRVFVYGSLLSGLNNHDVLGDSFNLAKNIIVSEFLMFDVGYFPACIHTKNPGDKILGEVYEVTPETFERLDRLEGYPQHYDRIQFSCMAKPTWIYVWNKVRNNMAQVLSGNWREYYEQKTT